MNDIVTSADAYIMEELKQVDIVGILPEVLLKEEVDGTLKHKGVIDGDVSDALLRDVRTTR